MNVRTCSPSATTIATAIALTTGLVFCVLVAGCSDDPAAPAGSTGKAGAGLPDAFLLSAEPDGARSLTEVRASAKAGDEVIFTARIGGRAEPFVAGRAVVIVADVGMPSCSELPGDMCPTPWDYCCESTESLLASIATVRFTDASGVPLRISLADQPGWKPLTSITVVGRVAETDPGNFVVNATGVYVPSKG